jgi:hypothetical protein
MDMKIKYFDLDNKLVNIRCKLYYNDTQNIRTVVLFGHGLSGHKDNRAAERFAGRWIGETEEAAVLAFNWPGHGDDKCELFKDGDEMDKLVISREELLEYCEGSQSMMRRRMGFFCWHYPCMKRASR